MQPGHKEKEVAVYVYSDLQCTISHRHYFFFGGGGAESRLTTALPLSRTMILPLESRVFLEYGSIHRVNTIKPCLVERTILEIDWVVLRTRCMVPVHPLSSLISSSWSRASTYTAHSIWAKTKMYFVLVVPFAITQSSYTSVTMTSGSAGSGTCRHPWGRQYCKPHPGPLPCGAGGSSPPDSSGVLYSSLVEPPILCLPKWLIDWPSRTSICGNSFYYLPLFL